MILSFVEPKEIVFLPNEHFMRSAKLIKAFFPKTAAGPPPPPLPPPLKAPIQTNHLAPMAAIELPQTHNGLTDGTKTNGNKNDNDSDEIDSDFGLEVVEEPTLRPSELVRGNHNRTMSTISGELLNCKFNATKKTNS